MEWMRWVDRFPILNYLLLAIGAILALGNGWFIRIVARPLKTQGALAAGAAVALIAALTIYTMDAPIYAAERRFLKYEIHSLHPIWPENENKWSPDDVIAARQHNEQYLSQFKPPEFESWPISERDRELRRLKDQAEFTNRYYAAMLDSWERLATSLLVLIGLTLESAWAADYLLRSRRGAIASVICYFELYVPAVPLLISCNLCLRWLFSQALPPPIPLYLTVTGPHWSRLFAFFVATTAWASLVHAGVIRRWRPIIRLAVHLAFIVLVVGWAIWLVKK
jgi:hypothetical protein